MRSKRKNLDENIRHFASNTAPRRAQSALSVNRTNIAGKSKKEDL